MSDRLHIPAEQVSPLRTKLFEEYGTTLRGLQAIYHVDVADYLAYVHDLPLREYIQPDPVLISILEKLPQRKFIFTNADVNHAKRVMRILEIEQYFGGIIDILAISPYCKPMAASFRIALEKAGRVDPHECVMIDDMPHTTSAARSEGMFSILFGAGNLPNSSNADATLGDWSELPALLMER